MRSYISSNAQSRKIANNVKQKIAELVSQLRKSRNCSPSTNKYSILYASIKVAATCKMRSDHDENIDTYDRRFV